MNDVNSQPKEEEPDLMESVSQESSDDSAQAEKKGYHGLEETSADSDEVEQRRSGDDDGNDDADEDDGNDAGHDTADGYADDNDACDDGNDACDDGNDADDGNRRSVTFSEVVRLRLFEPRGSEGGGDDVADFAFPFYKMDWVRRQLVLSDDSSASDDSSGDEYDVDRTRSASVLPKKHFWSSPDCAAGFPRGPETDDEDDDGFADFATFDEHFHQGDAADGEEDEMTRGSEAKISAEKELDDGDRALTGKKLVWSSVYPPDVDEDPEETVGEDEIVKPSGPAENERCSVEQSSRPDCAHSEGANFLLKKHCQSSPVCAAGWPRGPETDVEEGFADFDAFAAHFHQGDAADGEEGEMPRASEAKISAGILLDDVDRGSTGGKADWSSVSPTDMEERPEETTGKTEEAVSSVERLALKDFGPATGDVDVVGVEGIEGVTPDVAEEGLETGNEASLLEAASEVATLLSGEKPPFQLCETASVPRKPEETVSPEPEVKKEKGKKMNTDKHFLKKEQKKAKAAMKKTAEEDKKKEEKDAKEIADREKKEKAANKEKKKEEKEEKQRADKAAKKKAAKEAAVEKAQKKKDYALKKKTAHGEKKKTSSKAKKGEEDAPKNTFQDSLKNESDKKPQEVRVRDPVSLTGVKSDDARATPSALEVLKAAQEVAAQTCDAPKHKKMNLWRRITSVFKKKK